MAGIAGNLVDLLLFYTLERTLFNRMVGPMGRNPQLVKMAIAFWLLLEELGYHDLTRRINSFDDSTVDKIFHETFACLDCIRPAAIEPNRKTDDVPMLTTILDEPISRRFFYYNSGFMFRRFTHIMETVCNRIFGDHFAIEVGESTCTKAPAVGLANSTEGSSSTARKVADRPVIMARDGPKLGSDRMIKQPLLNPHASEFFQRQSNKDARTMFLTFSRGYPLTRQEIFNFFTSNWGDAVEDVVLEDVPKGDAPLCGRVIFTSQGIIERILNGKSKAKFIVGRKHLWARVYVPRGRR